VGNFGAPRSRNQQGRGEDQEMSTYIPSGLNIDRKWFVINASKVRLTGLKSQSKTYRRYTGFPGGLREESFIRLIERRPEKVVEEAIKGMLPKTKLGRKMATKLNVYRDEKHPHAAQKPQPLEVNA
jgi:large subunit ribosomal protein L13